jgi:FtsH-binding integral membrane protein
LIIGILAFSYYIIYNTNRVIKDNITDVWKAAVKFYVNFLNIMIQIFLSIFNKK